MRSMSSSRAVTMMMGIDDAARSRRQMLRPSSPGSMTSRMMRSTLLELSNASMSAADPTEHGSKPFSAKMSYSMRAISASSSTHRMRGFGLGIGDGALAKGARSCAYGM